MARQRLDLTGKRYGRLVVLGLDHITDRGESCWLCECDCGNTKVIYGGNLKRGLTTSCGCKQHERRSEDITGKRFGRLQVIGYDHTARNRNSYWLCECDCGNHTVVERSHLVGGRTISCGCKAREGKQPDDLTGKRYGKLYVVGLDHVNRTSGSYWLCECDCGNTILLRTRELLYGKATSCGCMDGRSRSIQGSNYDSLYPVWISMRQRCGNTSNAAYDRYGGRGIFVCDDWYEFENFRDWAFDNGYEPGLTLDRIDNDDGYYPENCRWVDRIIQANNRRSNHYFTYNGNTHTIAEWARILEVNYRTLQGHLRNNDLQDFEEYFGG